MRAPAGLLLLLATPSLAGPWLLRQGQFGEVQDAYLWSSSPDYNGSSSSLYTGRVGGGEKGTLIRFELSFVPPGSVVTKARVLLAFGVDGEVPIRVHPISAPWNESTVTWSSFDGGSSPVVSATFLPDAGGFSLAPLAQRWIDGSPNYGVYLDQAPGTAASVFGSSDQPQLELRPGLELEFTPPGPEERVVLQVRDAFVSESAPNLCSCCTGYDLTGGALGQRQVSLLWFDLAQVPAGSTVELATLRLREAPGSGDEHRVHRLLVPWSDTTVTWASLDGGFSPAIERRFRPNPDGGAAEVDLRALAQRWVDGAPNHGLALDQVPGTSLTRWYSAEAAAALRPSLELQFVRPFVDAGAGEDGGGPGDPAPRVFAIGCASAPAGSLVGLGLLVLRAVSRTRRRSP